MAKRIRNKWKAALLLVALMLSLSALPVVARADTLNWTITPTGTINYAGGSNSIVGASIGVSAVQDITTGQSFAIVNGILSFTSGPGNIGQWSWGAAPAGTLTLNGCISGITGNGNCSSSTAGGFVNLFSDDFTSAAVFQPFGTPNYQVQLGNVTGTLDSVLAAQFGVSAGILSALYNTTIDVQGAAFGSSFNGLNLGGYINATASAAPTQVPEPSSGSLVGFGLIGIAFAMVARRKTVAYGA